MGARDTALRVLIACRRAQAWSDGALKQQIRADGLDRRDAALASSLCYGVLQNRMLLDFWISRYLRGSLHALQPVVLDILRLAVYQIRFLDRIPPSAAVNQAVEQAKRMANPRAAGLVNGVLRSMLRDPARLSLPDELSVRYSHPEELISLLRDSVGQSHLVPMLAAHNEPVPTFLQVNTVRTDANAAVDSLTAQGFCVERHPWLPDCLMLSGGSVEQTDAFQNGWVYAQDPAARLAVLAAAPQPGMQVLDCCAAPGGKSFSAAVAMENRGRIISCDLHPHKIELIAKGAQRLGLQCITPMCADAGEHRPAWESAFDLVIADVPCSGLGVIRKKPDIRYKDLSKLEALPAIQRRILDRQAGYVRPGGILLYSTCTVLRRENEAVAQQFLAAHPEYETVEFSLPGGKQSAQGMLALLPGVDDTDGFFICKLRRKT